MPRAGEGTQPTFNKACQNNIAATVGQNTSKRCTEGSRLLFESLKTLRLAIQTWVDALWGYDVFIAHRRADAADYAQSLFTRLRGAGIAGFIDRVVYGPGDSLLISTRRHARKSTLLLVVGSPGLLPVRAPIDWVAEEITAYLDSHAHDPKVLLVTFGAPILEALHNPPPALGFLHRLQHFYRIAESLEALDQTPSDDVVRAILWQLRARRRDRTRLRFFRGIAGCLTLLLIALAVILSAEIQQRARAEQHLELATSQVVAADARLLAPSELNAALRQSARAYRINASDDARAALLDGLGRAARILGFYPCENGSIAGGVGFSTDDAPTVAFSCIRDHTSVVTIVAHDGQVRAWGTPGEVRTIAFLNSGFAALDGTAALRVMDVQTGRLREFNAGKDPLANIATLPGGDALLTVEAANRIRIWNHRYGASPESSWESGSPFTVPTSILDIEYNRRLGAAEVLGYDGGEYLVHLAYDPLARAFTNSGIPTAFGRVSSDTQCPQYPVVTRTNWRVTSHSLDGSLRAHLTEDNNVIVEENGAVQCTVLHGNTHNAQIAVSANGQRIATLGAYLSSDTVHGLILWDRGQLHPLAKVIWPEAGLPSVGFSKVALSYDGSSWVFVRPDGVTIWNGRSIDAPQGPNVRVASAALSRNGRDLSIGYTDGRIVRFVSGLSSPGDAPAQMRGSLQLSPHSIESLWYVDSDTYAMDEEGHAWRVPASGSPISLPLQRGTSDYPCQYLTQSGTDLVVETLSAGKSPALESLNVTNDVSSHFELPSDSGRCKSLVYSAAARVGVRIPLEYIDMYIFEPDKNPAFRPFPNLLHDISGLRKVLTNPVLSADGTALAAVASDNDIALFDVGTARLVGIMGAPRTNALAISGDGRKLLTYNERLGVIIWDIDAANWARIAANMAGADPRGLQ